MLAYKDRVKQAVSAGGTGALTLGAAVSQFQAFGAGDDGKMYGYTIEDGTAWETGFGTYTHSGTSFARTTRTASSTGSALTVSTSAFVFADVIAGLMTGYEGAIQTYISGCIVTKHSGANTLDISAGYFYAPDGNRIISYAGGSAVSAGSLGASQWNQVYIDSTGTVTVANNADPPSTTYAGNARKDGSSRRWVGSFLTDGSSNIFNAAVYEAAPGLLEVFYLTGINVSPFRVLAAVSQAGSYASQSLAGAIPRYAAFEAFVVIYLGNSAASGLAVMDLSIDGGSNRVFAYASYTPIGTNPSQACWTPIISSTPNIFYQTEIVSGTAAMYMDVGGFKALR